MWTKQVFEIGVLTFEGAAIDHGAFTEHLNAELIETALEAEVDQRVTDACALV